MGMYGVDRELKNIHCNDCGRNFKRDHIRGKCPYCGSRRTAKAKYPNKFIGGRGGRMPNYLRRDIETVKKR